MTPGLPIAAFARELGCSTDTLRRHVRECRLRAVDLGTTRASLFIPGEECERVRREGLRPQRQAIEVPHRGPTMAEALASLR